MLKYEKPMNVNSSAFLNTTTIRESSMSEYIVLYGIRIAKSFEPETFGRLTTIGPKFLLPIGRQGQYKSSQVCACICGEVRICYVRYLRLGASKSCGCLQRERAAASNKTHGGSFNGVSPNPAYANWQNMKRRCNNPKDPKYPDYGGRGIRVCDRWQGKNGFANFLSDMGERPSKDLSIDRHPNPDGNYEPGNCRWATNKEQQRNKRNNHTLTFKEKTQCVVEWAEELGMRSTTIYARLYAGWDLERALTVPVRKRNKKSE
jgi:hypothetical protein